MASNQWDSVTGLFQQALKLAPAQRAAFLAEAYERNPSLRDEVESLLASHQESDSFLEETPPVDSVTITRQKDDEVDNRQIGPYRILSEIGRGGMGVVYEAEQEKPVHRRVALKLIKWGMDTKAVIARFESERQALALMNHPNIASVYDAGATNEGRPYFAMELVHGEPITEYCDKNRLTIKERLGLFIQVCEGVQHAHQKGIIHRDIKPSNILITIQDDKPVPKIIDFGVAKATSQRLTERTVYTELGQLIGTPEYMSPEQAEMTGIDIDTRTDVYSLGVVLYELLVGAQPFDAKVLRQASFDDMRRKIREEEPPKPSTKLSHLGESSTTAAKNRRAELRSLERDLQGDLDWITMKALEKDRTRRYGSPSDLIADIVRHLKYEPVLASPPSALYRARKFIRRHKVGVTVAAGLVGLLVGVAVLMTVQSARIASERDRAESALERAKAEAAKTKAINEFLQEVLGSANPQTGLGHDVTLIEALDSATERISDSFRDQPEIEASVRTTLGLTYLELSQYDAAESQLQSALEIRKRNLPKNHADIAESLNNLAGVALGIDNEYAEELLREAMYIGRTLHGDDRLKLVNSLSMLAHLQTLRDSARVGKLDKGSYQAALERYEEALSLAREIEGNESDLVRELLSNMGVVAEYGGDLEAAEAAYRERLVSAEKDKIGHAIVLNNLGFVLHAKGDELNAEPCFRESLDIWVDVVGPSHITIPSAMKNIAMVLVARGRIQEAKVLLRDARKLVPEEWEEYLRDDLTPELWEECSTDDLRGVLRCCFQGAFLTKMGHYERAERNLMGALDFMKDRFPPTDPRTQRAFKYLVDLYETWGKPEKAAEYRAMVEEGKEPEKQLP